MQKKRFVSPEMEIVYFQMEEIVSTSNISTDYIDDGGKDNDASW